MRRTPSFLSIVASFPLLAAVAVATVAFAPGCTSSEVGCDDSKCGTGNSCIPFEGKTECRRTCTSNVPGQGACPYGYTCSTEGANTFCVKETVTLTRAPGQWGAACNPSGGLEANPDCNSAQGFVCHGSSPNDAESYCTREGCTEDRECGAGFYCGSANLEPNVTTTNRSVGPENTIRTCLKRTYCAPCKADVDCLPDNGRKQHCVADDDGNGVCSPECDSSKGCNNEAQCIDLTDFKVCFPRSGRCAGDGSLCSACRSDADCKDGACVKGQYTTEQFCTVKSTVEPCKDGNKNGVDFGCPEFTAVPGRPVACVGGIFFDQVPRNQCHTLYKVGGQYSDIGCWTPDR